MLHFLRWVVAWILLADISVGDFAPTVKMNEIKSEVIDILHFDDSPNVIALKDDESSVIASYDDGVSWTDISIMKGKQVGALVLDPIDKNRAYAISKKAEHFVTTNKGKSWKKFTTRGANGDSINMDIFNGVSVNTQNSEMVILKFSDLAVPHHTRCPHHYYTTDGFKTVKLLTDNALTCTFVMSTPQFAELKDPSTIVCARVKYNSFGHVLELQLVASTDFLKTERRIYHPLLQSGKIVSLYLHQLFMVVNVQTDKYLVKSQVAILVSKDAQTFDKADLEFEMSSNAVQLRSSSLALFLSVVTFRTESPTLTTIFRSDSSGLRFTKIIENVDYSSTYKLPKIDGVWLTTELVESANPIDDANPIPIPGRPKQKQYDSISKISMDDGQSWSPMEVVDDNSCLVKEGCSFHVLTFQSEPFTFIRQVHIPTPNILVATGTIGKNMGPYEDYKTYVSRDGGLTWKVTLQEPTILSYGDQGNIIVAFPHKTKDRTPTNKGFYSLNQGTTWTEFLLEKPIYPLQIVATADGTGKKFILRGEDVLYSIDFTGAFGGVKCLDEDLEKVYARVSGDLISCIYGHRESFMRRKLNAKCYVSTLFEDMRVIEEPCECTEHDFECSMYFKVSSNGECVPDAIKIASLCAGQKKESVKVANKQLQTDNRCKSDPQTFITTEEFKCNEYTNGDTERIVSTSQAFEGTLSAYTYTGDLLAENIVLQTHEGAVYASNNGGISFVRVSVSEKVLGILVGPSKNTVALITDSDMFYYSTDGGTNFTKLHAPGKSALKQRTISFHPEDPSQFIWFSGYCGESGASDCIIYYTKDRGVSFKKLLDGAVTCDYVSLVTNQPNSELIYCTVQEGTKKSLMSLSFSPHWSNEGKYWPKLLFENIMSYTVLSGFVLVTTIDTSLQGLYVKVTVDGTTFATSYFPSDFSVDENTSYAILDPRSHSIFMDISTDTRPGHERGTILKSNSDGTSYALVLENVNINTNGYVDYDRVGGIEGILIANTVQNPEGGGKKLKTQISFNDGSQWTYIPPPTVDSEGKKYPCSGPLGECSLNLHGFTEKSDYRDTYSSSSAVGFLIGTGNVGETLETHEKSSTFLSTDGGLSWTEVAKGVHHWEYGDQGTILVLVLSHKETNELLYSTDSGQVWQRFQFSDKPVSVLDLATVPSDTARKFVIFATSNSNKSEFTTYSIDFTNYFGRQCQLDLDNPDEDDYEYWAPKHPDSDEGCLFGHEVKFLRRAKNHTDCFIGAAPLNEGYKMIRNCACTRNDYGCDYNYFKDDDGTCKLVMGLSPTNQSAAKCDMGTSLKFGDTFQYFESTGYRKIPLSTCVGGQLFDMSHPRPCPGYEKEFNEFYGLNMGVRKVLLVVLIPLFVFIVVTWFVYDRGIRRNGGFKQLNEIRLDAGGDFSPVENNFVDVMVNRVVRGGIIVIAGTIVVLKAVRKIDRQMMERLSLALLGRISGRRNYVRVPGDEDELFGNFDTYDGQLDNAEVNFEVQEFTNYDPTTDTDTRVFDIDEQSHDDHSASGLKEAQSI